jgi:hypothetical protein
MTFDLLQAFTGRKPRSLDHLPLTWRYTVEGQRTIQSLQSLSRLTGSWKVCFLEAARWHTDLVLKREKQADHIGMRAAAVLARAKDGNDETL